MLPEPQHDENLTCGIESPRRHPAELNLTLNYTGLLFFGYTIRLPYDRMFINVFKPEPSLNAGLLLRINPERVRSQLPSARILTAAPWASGLNARFGLRGVRLYGFGTACVSNSGAFSDPESKEQVLKKTVLRSRNFHILEEHGTCRS